MPVYSSHLLEYDELRLGERLREARQRQGLTVKQLAGRMDTSPARLSQIENDRLRLDLGEVLKFAETLNVPLETLIPPDVRLPYQITRDADLRARPDRTAPSPRADEEHGRRSAHSFRPLADLFVGRHLEPMLGQLAPLAEDDLEFSHHAEEEFAFVLRGTVEFRIKTPEGESREELFRGDCIYFRSDLPHSFRSLDREPAESIHVYCSPSASVSGGFDGTSIRALANGDRVEASTDLERHIGRKLRLFREIHGWSLDRVARSAGLTVRQVARLEADAESLPLDALLKLARAFGKPLRELIGLAAARGPYYFIQRSKEIPAIPSRRRRTPVERPQAPPSKTCQPLAAGFPAKEMYPYFLRLLNVDIETLTLHEHHGQEFIYVLEGELELTTYTGDQQQVREVLRAGDSCYIDSSVPHLLRSWTRNPYSETSAEVIDVFWCPLGEAYLFEPRHA